MVDWNSPRLIMRATNAFEELIFCFFGLYIWELFMTCDFEWALITGRRKFTWPLVIFFFLCRYCIFFALIGLIISFSINSPINCDALFTFNSWTGNMSILCASTSLMIRTIALWNRKLSVVIPLGFLCLGHWAILWRGMFIVHATYDETLRTCIVTKTDHVFLNVGFFTTIVFDTVILCFTMAALLKEHAARTHLWQLLFRDGLVYFLITVTCNAVPAILNVLDLNTIMDVIATVPAATVSCIAACRLVIRLHSYNQADPYIHSSQVLTGGNRGSPLRLSHGHPKQYPMPIKPEVRVTTDQYVMQDLSPVTSLRHPRSPITSKSEKVVGEFV
ncbi:hypothetical protein ABKN59_000226 [Abortiporus biennis]